MAWRRLESQRWGDVDLEETPEERVPIGPLALDQVDLACATARISASVGKPDATVVLTPNLDHIYLARRDPNLARRMRNASLALTDGVPLLWVARLAGTPLPGRVNGTDLMHEVIAACERESHSIYLFGGRHDSAENAANRLHYEFPDLRIAGATSPPDGLMNSPVVLARALDAVAASGSDVVFVGLPTLLQVIVAEKLTKLLPGSVIIGVGVSFEFIHGAQRRAPRWAQKVGMEWVFRMFSDPRRLARRYIVCNLPVLVGLVAEAASTRIRSILASDQNVSQ